MRRPHREFSVQGRGGRIAKFRSKGAAAAARIFPHAVGHEVEVARAVVDQQPISIKFIRKIVIALEDVEVCATLENVAALLTELGRTKDAEKATFEAQSLTALRMRQEEALMQQATGAAEPQA